MARNAWRNHVACSRVLFHKRFEEYLRTLENQGEGNTVWKWLTQMCAFALAGQKPQGDHDSRDAGYERQRCDCGNGHPETVVGWHCAGMASGDGSTDPGSLALHASIRRRSWCRVDRLRRQDEGGCRFKLCPSACSQRVGAGRCAQARRSAVLRLRHIRLPRLAGDGACLPLPDSPMARPLVDALFLGAVPGQRWCRARTQRGLKSLLIATERPSRSFEVISTVVDVELPVPRIMLRALCERA